MVFAVQDFADEETLREVGLEGVDALVLDDQPQAWQESDRSRVLHVHEFRVDRDTDVEKERTYLDRLFKDLCADPKLPGIPDTAATRAIGTFPARDTAPGSGPARRCAGFWPGSRSSD